MKLRKEIRRNLFDFKFLKVLFYICLSFFLEVDFDFLKNSFQLQKLKSTTRTSLLFCYLMQLPHWWWNFILPELSWTLPFFYLINLTFLTFFYNIIRFIKEWIIFVSFYNGDWRERSILMRSPFLAVCWEDLYNRELKVIFSVNIHFLFSFS